MQKFYRFWKKDFLNKIIVLVVFLIVTAVAVDLIMLMTHRSAGSSLLAEFNATPTTELKVILTRNAATAEYQSAMATASVPPTVTTMPFTYLTTTATFKPALLTPTPEVTLGTPTPTQTTGTSASLACLPNTPPQLGTVVEIVDGYNIRVLIDGLVYTVRYLGIAPPADENFAGQASSANTELVYGKDITLISDNPDKDLNGRPLRYVIVDDTLVNLELLQQGLATTINTDPLISCADAFKQAEQSAREAQRGYWKIAPEP